MNDTDEALQIYATVNGKDISNTIYKQFEERYIEKKKKIKQMTNSIYFAYLKHVF